MEGETNRHRDSSTHLEQDICIHIFTVSSAMVGVCLTVIGLIRVVITLGRADTLADDLLAGDALLFLISCLLSYWGAAFALRAPNAWSGKVHRWNIYSRHDWHGDRLCLDHLHDLCSSSAGRWLKQLFKNSQPISAQNFFDVSVAESTFDQCAGEVARVRMVR